MKTKSRAGKARTIKSPSKSVGTGEGSALRCQACGMVLRTPAEYHPYASCLMFKGCGDSATVRANLSAAGADTLRMDKLASRWDSQGKGHHICGKWVPNVTGSFRDAIDAFAEHPK